MGNQEQALRWIPHAEVHDSVSGQWPPVYGSSVANSRQIFYGNTPGSSNSLGNPGNLYVPQTLQNAPSGVPGNVDVDQVLYSRTGQVLTVAQVYSNWDPSVNQQPDDASLMPYFRDDLDGYPAQYNDWYWMDQMSFMHDRLHIMYGYRNSEIRQDGQIGTVNFPYYAPPPYAGDNQTVYNPNVFDYGASYALSQFGTLRGSGFQYGATFDITKEITAYATFSRTFKFNFFYRGGETDGNADLPNLVNAALSNGGGSYLYLGTTVTSVNQGTAIVIARGAQQPVSDESGYNYEAGLKTSLWDGKLSGTLAFFRGTRSNVATDDAAAQSTASRSTAARPCSLHWPARTTTPAATSAGAPPVRSS